MNNKNQFSFSDLTSNLKLIDVIQLGYQPNKTNSGSHSIAIGSDTGIINQGTSAIAIGYQAGQYNQGSNSIAIGKQAGQTQQKQFGIAIGTNAGQHNQGTASIAIGYNSGQTNQNMDAITIGTNTGQHNQGTASIAIGYNSGQINQGSNSIAIGYLSGQTNQSSNSIILNSSGNAVNANTSGLFVNPIRTTNEPNNSILLYNSITSEIIKQPFPYSIGDLKYTLSNVDHNHWLLCDGRSLNTIDYPLLFDAIGYSFGGSGGSFNLPDPRSRSIGFIGQGDGLSNRTLGQNVGSETHSLNVSEIPDHNHTITDPGHTHTYQKPPDFIFGSGFIILGDLGADYVYPTFTSGSSTTGISIDSSGLGQPYNLFQPTTFIGNIFIYSD